VAGFDTSVAGATPARPNVHSHFKHKRLIARLAPNDSDNELPHFSSLSASTFFRSLPSVSQLCILSMIMTIFVTDISTAYPFAQPGRSPFFFQTHQHLNRLSSYPLTTVTMFFKFLITLLASWERCVDWADPTVVRTPASR
jgi:hypothetical protein